MPKLNKIQVFY